MKKQDGRLGVIAFYMNEVEALAFHLGHEVGQSVEASFDRTPIVAVAPVGGEPLKIIDPDPG